MVSTPLRKMASAASGSCMMFASAPGVTLPGTVSAPPMNVMEPTSSPMRGSRRQTSAIVVIAPVGTMTKSLPYVCAPSMMKSAAAVLYGERRESGIVMSPMPLSALMRRVPADGE